MDVVRAAKIGMRRSRQSRRKTRRIFGRTAAFSRGINTMSVMRGGTRL